MCRFSFVAALWILALLLSATPVMAAGWVDDWLTQTTSTSSTYFEGQKRGYYSAGSYSARWPVNNDYLVTVQTPKLGGGCGGVDLFGGGVSFLNFDYLVDKLQRVLQNGGVVAFELALNTLCPECVNVVNNVESIANKLNSMQIDECASAKKTIATLSQDGRDLGRLGDELATSIKKVELKTGISDLWSGITEDHTARKGVTTAAENKSITEGCPTDIKEMFLANFSGAESSLLQSVGVGKMGMTQTYVDMVRGLVGDIKVAPPEQGYVVSYVPPCVKNAGDDSKTMLDGKAEAKDVNGACAVPASTNADLVKYFQDKMVKVAGRIRSKQALDADDVAFMQSNPLSIGLVLKTAVGTEMEGQTIAVMADLTAKAHALQLLSDLYYRAKTIADRGQALLSKPVPAVDGKDPSTCAANVFADNFLANVDKMLDEIYRLQDGAKKSYSATAQEMALNLGMIDQLRQGNERLKAEVAKRFSPALANQLFN